LDGGSLEKLQGLCSEYRTLEKEIEEVGRALSQRKEQLEKISREYIPSLLTSVGLSEIRLSSGEKVKVEDKIKASITNKNIEFAYVSMIKEEGGDDLAKEVIDSLFKDQILLDEVSEELIDFLLEEEIPYESKKSIHPQTLKKYCSERLNSGKNIPDGISVYQYQETKITL